MRKITIEIDEHDALMIEKHDAIVSNLNRKITDEEMETLRDHQSILYWKLSREIKKGA